MPEYRDSLVDGPDTTRRIITAWSAVVGAVGVALMFRTPLEQITGAIYLTGSVLLATSAYLARVRILAVAGFSIISLAFASRAVSAFWLPTEWHGKTIIVSTWGGLSWIAYSRARRIAGGH